jgi:hypothetical protein
MYLPSLVVAGSLLLVGSGDFFIPALSIFIAFMVLVLNPLIFFSLYKLISFIYRKIKLFFNKTVPI